MMLHRRHFTLDQANARLPEVGRLLHDMRDARETLLAQSPDTPLAAHAEATGGAWPGREHATASLVLSLGFEALEELDVLVRDADRGVVDFPALLDGREIYLCWHVGELEITHWHELEAGFAGRRVIADAARRP
jgi:hypothetical protein